MTHWADISRLCGSPEDFFRVYFRDIELGELGVAELRFRSVRAMP